MHSPDLVEGNLEKIAALFPNVITESKNEQGKLVKSIDFELLKAELSAEVVEGSQERYHLNWPGKREALLAANSPIAKTLRPVREESVDFDTTENLFIEGDNLDALILLQDTYLGKVKMIYIDPPYNPGKDFIYADNFAESREDYLLDSGQTDEEGNRLVANLDSNGRFHSDWLSMMYPRLKLARNLLREDGVIFISIDEGEVANVRKVCDEVFGEKNFIECISWNKRIPKNDKGVGSIHEYILIFVKNTSVKPIFTMRKDGLEEIDSLVEKLKKKATPFKVAENEIRKFYKKQGFDRGITLYNSFDQNYKLWGKINMSWPNANSFGPRYEVLHPITKQPVRIPDRGWRWKKETFEEAANIKEGQYQSIDKLWDGSVICGKIWFAPDEDQQPSSVTFLEDVNDFLLRSIISLKSNGGIEVEKLFEGKSFFPYPKPLKLLKILLSSQKSMSGDIILDFFSGSATTAHSVFQLNAEDGGNRKFIMVQLPEETFDIVKGTKVPKKGSEEAFKAGYTTIAEISKERIRRAGRKIRAELLAVHEAKQKEAGLLQRENPEPAPKLDIGFRVLKVDTSNMKDVYYTPDALPQDLLSSLEENIKPDRTAEDLLFQVLLDWGVDLSLPIVKEEVAGREVFFVNEDALAACFVKDGEVTEDFCKELARRKPLRVVFRGAGVRDDAVKINVEQVFKLLSPHTDIKTI